MLATRNLYICRGRGVLSEKKSAQAQPRPLRVLVVSRNARPMWSEIIGRRVRSDIRLKTPFMVPLPDSWYAWTERKWCPFGYSASPTNIAACIRMMVSFTRLPQSRGRFKAVSWVFIAHQTHCLRYLVESRTTSPSSVLARPNSVWTT